MRHARFWLSLSCIVLLALAAGATRQEAKSVESGLSIQYLANEGFLIRGNERSVLIDAFVGEPYHEYAALPPELLKQLRAAKAPFDAIDLALTSHIHRDHFQAEVACAFLGADTDVPMWSAEQVIDAIRKQDPKLPGDGTRLRSFWCEAGKSLGAELEGVKLEFFPLHHVKDIQNLAHLIDLGDWRVLHVGDASLDAKEYAPYKLATKQIDVAFLPFWYFLDAKDCANVREWIGAKRYVAMHVPPKDFVDVRRTIAANFPGVLMLEKGGDATRIDAQK